MYLLSANSVVRIQEASNREIASRSLLVANGEYRRSDSGWCAFQDLEVNLYFQK